MEFCCCIPYWLNTTQQYEGYLFWLSIIFRLACYFVFVDI